MSGQLAFPLSIGQGASDSRMQAGHTAYLRGGNYVIVGALPFSRGGVSYQPYAQEKPTLQIGTGNITIDANGITFTNLEIAGVNSNRVSAQSGSTPTDIDYYRLIVNQPNVTFRGCYIHDITELAVDAAAHTFTMIDCVLFNCGWEGSDHRHGHLFYGQNNGLGAHRLINCIFGQSMAYGMHFYGVNAALRGLYVDRLIQFTPAFVIGGETNAVLDDVTFTNGVLWNIANVHFGYSSSVAGSLTLIDNYFAASTPVVSAAWQNITNIGNITAAGGLNTSRVFLCSTPPQIAHIAVMNWQQLNSVAVPVGGLTIGNTYVLRNAYDPLADTTTFVYGGGDVPINMLGRGVALPFGYPTPLAVIDKRFGAWILEG